MDNFDSPGTVAIWLVLNALACYRLTRMLVWDTLLEPWRRWLTSNWTGSLVELFLCPWCLSVWIAAGTVVLTWIEPVRPIWFWIGAFLAISAVAGLIAQREDR